MCIVKRLLCLQRGVWTRMWETSEEAISLVQMNWNSSVDWSGNSDGTEEGMYMELGNVQWVKV